VHASDGLIHGCYSVTSSAGTSSGFGDFNWESVVNLGGATVCFFFGTAMYLLVMKFREFYRVEITDSDVFRCRTLVRTFDIPIVDIQRLTIGGKDQLTGIYRGDNQTTNIHLKATDLDEFALARLSFFFESIASIDPETEMTENVDFKSPLRLE
jgi:hypothetical protein